jgi:hypothetical protein
VLGGCADTILSECVGECEASVAQLKLHGPFV